MYIESSFTKREEKAHSELVDYVKSWGLGGEAEKEELSKITLKQIRSDLKSLRNGKNTLTGWHRDILLKHSTKDIRERKKEAQKLLCERERRKQCLREGAEKAKRSILSKIKIIKATASIINLVKRRNTVYLRGNKNFQLDIISRSIVECNGINWMFETQRASEFYPESYRLRLVSYDGYLGEPEIFKSKEERLEYTKSKSLELSTCQ